MNDSLVVENRVWCDYDSEVSCCGDPSVFYLQAGGLSAMSPRDVTRVLWGFASLGHTPTALLLSIRPDWSWREQQPGATEQEEQGKRRGKGKKSKAKSEPGGVLR